MRGLLTFVLAAALIGCAATSVREVTSKAPDGVFESKLKPREVSACLLRTLEAADYPWGSVPALLQRDLVDELQVIQQTGLSEMMGVYVVKPFGAGSRIALYHSDAFYTGWASRDRYNGIQRQAASRCS